MSIQSKLRVKTQILENLLNQLDNQSNKIDLLINKTCKKLKLGGKIMICGNGGSAADSDHLAAEFIVRLKPKINREPIPAISLTLNTAAMSACSNDYNFNDVFLRSFKALYKKNDILLLFSTSGKSKNVINVAKFAKKQKVYTQNHLTL